jgi:putative transcriptional regulator
MTTNQFECCELNTETNPARTAISNRIPGPGTNEFLEASAREDRDPLPLTKSFVKRTKGAPQVKVIRRALKLTQEEFAARYHIPIGTLRDWEQGRSEPDQATRAYLVLIARDPDYVNRVLNQPPDEPVRLEPA